MARGERMRSRRALLLARAAAWVFAVAGIAVAPFWVSILRDLFGVGCQNLEMAGDNAHVCLDGIGYIGVGLMYVVFSLVVSASVILTQWRFGSNPSASTWRLHWVPFALFVALCAGVAETARSGTGAVAGAAAPLGVLALGTGALLAGLVLTRWSRASRVAHCVAVLAFVALVLLEYRSAPVAILGAAIALVSALDLVHLLTIRTPDHEPVVTAKG